MSCTKNHGKKSAQLRLSSLAAAHQNGRGAIMLRVQTQELDGALICRLEGRFTGEGAEEVRRLVTRCESQLELVVDLTEVMFIDAIGEEVLLFVKRLGAQFVAETSYSRDVCERLQLPLIGKRKSNMQVPANSKGNGQRPWGR
jgi:STAS domain